MKVKLHVNQPTKLNATIKTKENKVITGEVGAVQQVVTSDYNQLENIPTLNGIPIVGDIEESDPSVGQISIQDVVDMFKD